MVEEEFTWLLYGLILSLKCLLIRCYHSTDFEVHRNWMAITHHLPLARWYYSEISEWTLDYPPFFAYFEKMLSYVANFFDADILVLQKAQFFSENALLFQRFSVIVVDYFYFMSCVFLSKQLSSSAGWIAKKPKFGYHFEYSILSLLLMNPALILLDNVHFQYNSFMYGILFLAIGFILSGNYLKGAFFFAVLLNFKHIFLYYVPAFTLFYLFNYLSPLLHRNAVRRIAGLAIVLMVPLLFSFGPFVLSGGMATLQQILQRLFPFKRGLTHAYWAPNFWTLYNFVDFLFYKIVSHPILSEHIFGHIASSPQYTRGMVLEYSHSVMPNVNATATLLLTVLACVPLLFVMRKRDLDNANKFLIGLVISAYAFFFFGWHVHEKALLMVFLPMLMLTLRDLRFVGAFHGLCFSTVFCCFPLFFTPLENLLKHVLGFGYLILHFSVFQFVFKISPKNICSKLEMAYLALLSFTEIYNSCLHKAIFGGNAEFLPLMTFSIMCSLGVVYSYAMFIWSVFAGEFRISLARRQCIKDEQKILNNFTYPDAHIQLVAGVDISACVDQPHLAIASITVLSLPDLKIEGIMDEVLLLEFPYIPEYLAIRESKAMANLIVSFSSRTNLKPDIVFVDGNGQFHSRCCGLASHVGFLANIMSVGVAKNFNGFPLHSFGYSQNETNQIEQDIIHKCRQIQSAAVIELGLTSPGLLSVLRPKSSSSPLFISAGFNVEQENAIVLATECVAISTTNPIRLSDLRSRSLLQTFYGT